MVSTDEEDWRRARRVEVRGRAGFEGGLTGRTLVAIGGIS